MRGQVMGAGVGAGILLALASVPVLTSSIYLMHVLIVSFMFVVLAVSWNIIGGMAGYVSFGHVTFFALGAYLTAILYRDLGASPFLTAPLGGILAAAVAYLLGWATLRLREDYFAIATLGLAFIFEVLAWNLPVTGGGSGIMLTAPNFGIHLTKAVFYLCMWAIMVATVLTSWAIGRSRFGYGLASIREDEEAAEVVGVRTARLKRMAFVLSAFFPGMAGGIFSYYIAYIEPGTVFDHSISINVVIMSILGGIGTTLGPVLGAVILSLVSEVMNVVVASEAKLVVYGVILVSAVLFLPQGILGRLRGAPGPAAVAAPAGPSQVKVD
ncbi:MAG: branched-chain amino acid ABC transporter permease [Candidatus Methylomirabilota bacterium]